MLRKVTITFAQRYCQRYYSRSPETELAKQLKARIKLNGPLTVSAYMKEVLTNPTVGYYMHRDVFGTKGDFITSPEISQVFGELIGIWCVNEWMQCGSPEKIQVVELGPGRGTLSDDMLRVFSKFDGLKEAVSLHLVEVSPKLSEIQHQLLACQPDNTQTNTSVNQHLKPEDTMHKETYYNQCVSKYGPNVFWHKQLQQVPKMFSFYIAHEFFDALPIHKFQQKQDGQWHEVLIDMDDTEEGPHHFRYVLSPRSTVASKVLLQVDSADKRDHIELSPESGVIVEDIAARIAQFGGFSLIADYGHNGEKTDTFRAFKEHKLHDALCEPGLADLTADVDFKYLQNIVQNYAHVHGPVTQESFLHNMGIGVRMQVLMEKANAEQRKDLITSYDMLTNPQKMGERFKFLAMSQKGRKDYTPAGFKALH